MSSAAKHSSIVCDSHGRGCVATEGNLVSMTLDSSEKRKEFLPLGVACMQSSNPQELPPGHPLVGLLARIIDTYSQ